MPPIRHIVLINWRKDASSQQINDWISYCERIPQKCSMVHNWSSGQCVTAPVPDKPSTHEFGITFDLRSEEEWVEYLNHPYPESVYAEGLRVIDLERTASANLTLEAEPSA